MTYRPFVVNGTYRYRSHVGLHHWRVRVGILEALVVAPSHQVAKSAAMTYWTTSRSASFVTNLAARIKQVGIKARREMKDCTAEMSG